MSATLGGALQRVYSRIQKEAKKRALAFFPAALLAADVAHWFIHGVWWNVCLGVALFVYAVGVVLEMFDYAMDPHPSFKVAPLWMRTMWIGIFLLPVIPLFLPGGIHAYGDAVLVAIVVTLEQNNSL